MNKHIKTAFIVIISCLVWVSLFEGAATFWVRRFGDPLMKAKEILDINPYWGWQQKSGFSGTFAGLPLKTNTLGLRNKPLAALGHSKKILVLGPSSTFGWGVRREETYSAVLEELLRAGYPGTDIDVINAGQIGFSSWQGVHFYQSLLSQAVDAQVIVIAYGINDVDRFRFFDNSALPDKDEYQTPKSPGKTAFANFLNRWNFLNLAAHQASRWAGLMSCDEAYLPRRRVSDLSFIHNISELMALAQERGASVILLTSPYSLPAFDPVDDDQEKQAVQHLQMGKAELKKGNFRRALSWFEQSAAINPEQNELFYYMSVSHAGLGECRQSRAMFERARSTESKRITRDIRKLNGLLEEIAGSAGVPLVETPAGIAASYDREIFVDPIHLSDKGNKIVAQKIADVILQEGLLDIANE